MEFTHAGPGDLLDEEHDDRPAISGQAARARTAMRPLQTEPERTIRGTSMPIKIFKGFVGDYASGSGRTSAYFPGAITFSIDDPPVNFWSPLSFGETPFAAGDYVAVAGKPTIVPGVNYVALAYRRLGAAGTAHYLNVGLPGACILFGALGAFGGLFLGPLDVDTRALTAVLLAVGLFGIWRLWSMHSACRILDKLQSSLSTYGQEQ